MPRICFSVCGIGGESNFPGGGGPVVGGRGPPGGGPAIGGRGPPGGADGRGPIGDPPPLGSLANGLDGLAPNAGGGPDICGG